ncbi:MAG: ORF6N domain-containing protein, partial [Chitinophagaceae bacterium]
MAKAKRNMIRLIPDETIIRRIYVIREQKVMLDFDLAALYEVETKALNQAVKRNLERFPEDFMYRLTPKEWHVIRSQIDSPQSVNYQHIKGMRSQFVT